MAEPKKTADDQLADDLSQFYDDPLGHVMYSYPWDTDPTIQMVVMEPKYAERFPGAVCKVKDCPYHEELGEHVHGPDEWSCEFLDDLGQQIKDNAFDGRNAVDQVQYSTSSGHGIGKSALVAWLIKFIMDTRPLSKGTVTANTAEQLKTKTWAELGKWHRMSMTEHWFDYNSGRGAMSLVHKERPAEWFCTAQTCKEENSEAFAGQHAPNATSFYIFDEAGGVPDKIFEVREGGTTDGEPMTFDFGNPTRNTGRFFENCVGRFKHRFRVRQIDSRDVKITNKKRIQEWIDDYGEENDYVKVRVRGVFPSVGDMQFMGTDLIEQCMTREVVQDDEAALVLGVDVARFGSDESVIYPRVGYDARSWPARRFRGLRTTQLVSQVVMYINDFRDLGIQVDGLFVDVGGVGGGVVDQLFDLGYSPISVNFGGKPTDGKTYRYKIDEMWGAARDALDKLCLPATNQENGNDIKSQLTQRQFGYTISGNKIQLETKKDMKLRLGDDSSPDLADGLMLTFAEKVVSSAVRRQNEGNQRMALSEYDPHENI